MKLFSYSKKLKSRPRLSVHVDKESLEACIFSSQNLLMEKSHFVELGGALLGYFDGVNVYITKFIIDEESISSPGSIRFSQNLFKTVRELIRKNQTPIMNCYLGTWHIHPSGYGVHFSPVDESYLFQEKWLLQSDMIAPEAPKVHLIMDIEKREFRVFTMRIKEGFEFKDVKINENKLKNILKNYLSQEFIENGGLLFSQPLSIDLSSEVPPIVLFHPEYYLNSDKKILGFWRHFPYDEVCAEFEEVFLAHFSIKFNMDNFYYLKSLGSPDSIQEVSVYSVQRQNPSSEDVQFSEVEYIIEKIIQTETEPLKKK